MQDAEAVDRIFAQDPNARVLWAHSGFDNPEDIAVLLRKHKNLWADRAFRSEHATAGKVDPHWRKLFLDFPDRFMIGTDTYAPERWYYVIDQAARCRQWLSDLPDEVAKNIAYRNAGTLARWALGSNHCGTGTTVTKGGYRLSYRFEPAVIQVGQPFAVRIAVCGADQQPVAGSLRVDARMPAHKHGMNYNPVVSATAPGVFRADGLMLHMRGAWRFDFELTTAMGVVRLRADHHLE